MNTLREAMSSGYDQIEILVALTVLAALVAVVLPLVVERITSRGY